MNRLSPVALLAACFALSFASPLRADQLGHFTFTDHGSTISIDRYTHYIKGDVVIPPYINGKPVTEIGPFAFQACRRVTSIKLPESITKIGKSAFDVCDKVLSLKIPSGVTAIEDETFYGCHSLKQLDLPAGVTRIGKGAFQFCTSLESFALPPLVTTLSENMFGSCGRLRNIPIPPRVTRIEDGALAGTGVTSLTIPGTVQHLGSRQFFRCLNLKKIKIQCRIPEIGEDMFAYCESLENVELPRGLQIIGKKAFWNCLHLPTVTIPKTVNRIENRAFFGCRRLEGACFEGDAPQMGTNVFKGTPSNFRIIIEDNRTGYTIPRWLGYRLSKARTEILIQNSSAESLDYRSVKPVRFASVIVGKNSITRSLVITNVGNRTLTGIDTAFNGEAFLEYTLLTAPQRCLRPVKVRMSNWLSSH